MESFVLKAFAEYGFPTGMVLVMTYLFITFTNSHKVERKEWRDESRELSNRHFEAQDTTNKVLGGLENVIREINRK